MKNVAFILIFAGENDGLGIMMSDEFYEGINVNDMRSVMQS